MTNPHERKAENMQVRVRCHGIGHMDEHESLEAHIHHVEDRTCHPHFSLD